MILGFIDEAQVSGARLHMACKEVGLAPTTIQRWRRRPDGGDDLRHGPKTSPKNKLSELQRRRVLEVANSQEFRNLSPKQIVPALADRDLYIGSESTFYRVLRAEKQLAHRGRAKPPVSQPPSEHRATGPNPRLVVGHHLPEVLHSRLLLLPLPVRGRVEPEDRGLGSP